MSDVAIGRTAAPAPSPFGARAVLLMLLVGIVGFVGTLVLGAYAPDWRSGHNGGAHALSNAAVGYSGLVQLAAATGRNPRIVRDERELGGDDLLVLTPEDGTVDLSAALAGREGKPTLVVLPKWVTSADRRHAGWVRAEAIQPPLVPEGVLAPAHLLHVAERRSEGRPLLTDRDMPKDIRFTAPRPLQVITGFERPRAAAGKNADEDAGTLVPMITAPGGGTVLAQFGRQELYVLADPDLLSNRGMKSARQAASALALLDWLNNNQPTGIDFDVTLNGLGRTRTPLKLALSPPFLAATLAIAAAVLLAGWHALATFGAARPRARAIAFGKAALVDNSAALVRRAGREARLGDRYAAVIRERARRAFGVPARLKGAALDTYLDGLGRGARFSDLALTATGAQDRDALLDAARALHDWETRS